MTTPDPEAMAKNVMDAFAAYNRHDLEPYLAMLDPDYVALDPTMPEPMKGRETVRRVNQDLFRSFPDVEFRILAVATGDDTVGVEYVISGTFKGPLEFPGRTPIPPTGQHLEARLASFWRVNSKGLFTEGRNYYYDYLGFLKQLGMMGGVPVGRTA